MVIEKGIHIERYQIKDCEFCKLYFVAASYFYFDPQSKTCWLCNWRNDKMNKGAEVHSQAATMPIYQLPMTRVFVLPEKLSKHQLIPIHWQSTNYSMHMLVA